MNSTASQEWPQNNYYLCVVARCWATCRPGISIVALYFAHYCDTERQDQRREKVQIKKALTQMDRYCRYQSHPLHRTSSELNKTSNTNYSTNQEIFTISWEYIYHQSRDLYSVTIRIVHLNCGINSSVESVLVCLCRTERLVEVLTNLVVTIHLCGKSTLR